MKQNCACRLLSVGSFLLFLWLVYEVEGDNGRDSVVVWEERLTGP